MRAAPTVTAIIPVHNGETFLREAIESALAQVPPPVEVVVVDDGSTDGSATIARSYGPPVRCVQQAQGGPAAAINRGVEEARAPFVAILGADDVWSERKTELQLEAVSRADLVFGHMVSFSGERVAEPEPARLDGTMLVARDVFARVGPFSVEVGVGYFLDWLMRCRSLGLREEMVSDVVLRRRIHATNMTRSSDPGDYARVLAAGLRRRRAATEVAVVVTACAGDVGRDLARAVASVTAQDVAARVIVVENASPMASAELGAVTVIRSPRRLTRGAARNTGLAAVSEPFVVFLDADDVMLPGSLAALLAGITEAPAAVAHVLPVLDGRSGRVVRAPLPVARLATRRPGSLAVLNAVGSVLPTPGATILRTGDVRTVGGYGEAERGEAWMLGMRLATRGPITFGTTPALVSRPREDHEPNQAEMLATAGAVWSHLRDDPALGPVARAALPVLGAIHATAVAARPGVRALRDAAASPPACWPSETEADLVRAAAYRDERAVEAWGRCRDRFVELGPIAARLAPAIFRMLEAHRVEDPLRDILKGAYRRTWYLNGLALRDAADAVTTLRTNGTPVLLLKGAGLISEYYGDVGVRPMNDIDLLVKPEDATSAGAALRAAGWRAVHAATTPTSPLRNEHLLVRGHTDLDLHHYSSPQATDDSAFWSGAVATDLVGTKAMTLCPEDHMLNVVVRGLVWSANAPSAWAVDALVILEHCGAAFDWGRVVEQASARHVTIPVRDALAHLAARFDVAVPASALDELRSAPASLRERLAHRAALRPLSTTGLSLLSWDRYRRFAQHPSPDRRPANLAAFLADGWGLDGPVDVARVVLQKVVRRNHRRARGRVLVTSPVGASIVDLGYLSHNRGN